jgi:3-oxoacyl-(acyl-carrier-protein) synthase/thioesterase domain-containing protein/acyl carrier protein
MSAVAESALLGTIAGTVASTLKIPVERLDVDADFDSFGMDSIIAIELMTNLSKQLNISITPAQLTSVNSVRELAGAIEGSMAPPTPAAKVPAAPAEALRASAQTRVRRAAPARETATPIDRLLRFVRDEYGLDLRGERFTSEDVLIEHLLEHHSDALSHYYGLSGMSTHAEVDEAPHAAPVGNPEIAVIGMACAFADATTPEALWRNLSDERSSIRALDGDRWSGAQNPSAVDMPRWGARINDADQFDAEFFGLSEHEARLCDPQERLMMQSVYHALQHAGLRADKLRGSRTALFLGYEYSEYEHYLRRNLHRIPDAPAFSSSSPIYYLANRISFLFDFKGPSEVVNASCASSGLAIHRAFQALAQGECDLAICGGVSLNLFADDYAAIGRYGLLSSDGRCAVFDDEANGFTRGEGLGLLVLKRLDDAKHDNNRVFARIAATHQTNRGRAAFTSEIKHEAITQVIADCYDAHAIDPGSVRYLEVDGYATKWGDSFEFEGIRNAFQRAGNEGKHCALGSIKGNIGHVEPASGVASAIKVVLSLYHGRFPATITKHKVNAFIDIESSAHPLYIADRELPLDELRRHGEPIRAGINSFSDSGVNVHLVFEEHLQDLGADAAGQGDPQLFLFSARSSESLLRYLDAYIERLGTGIRASDLEDLAYTTQMAMEPMEHRVALIAAGVKALSDALARARKLVVEGKSSDGNGQVFVSSVKHDGNGRILDVIQSQIGEDRLLDNIRAGQLREIALLWTSGIDIPWDRHWHRIVQERRDDGQRPPRLIGVPAYPFAKRRHWLDFQDDEQVKPVAAPTVPTPAPIPVPPVPEIEVAMQDVPRYLAQWRFVVDANEPIDDEDATLDGEDKIRLFMAQASAYQLGCPIGDIDEDVDFISLGFNSIDMAGMIQQLIDLLSENIAPSLVFKYRDIRSLARYLADAHPAKLERIRVAKAAGAMVTAGVPKVETAVTKSDSIEAWFLNRGSIADGLIVPMQTRATGTPIFAVPGADGSVFSLQNLAQSMAGVRPMFAFEGVGVDGKREPLSTVAEMADACIEAMSAIRNTGEIDLLGYSNGAIVAFEMARKLSAKNVRIGRLVLIDQLCPTLKGHKHTDADAVAGVFADLIPALGGKRMLDAEAFAAIPKAERADYLYELMQDNGFGISREQFVATYRFALANDEACRRYKPAKIGKPIRTVVVRATAGGYDGPVDLGWSKYLTRPAVCIGIDTDHLSIVGKPASARIADIFSGNTAS